MPNALIVVVCLMGMLMEKELMGLLESKLKKHDWSYMFSDDRKAYKKGREESIEIQSLIQKTGAEGKELFCQYQRRFWH
ncbi:hypothetical protein [Pleionea sp. CnH1-48]|uniref:hypothetical protein n=1 Tax=Pleionea sp. CnH1-48 TaxID=2954494 RepID=UPI002096B14E|nr:hypothetical protein [Pleionea sp. CnH1-48]MCO7225899.1 hypothetical protein [Pleionea sp. CnH1-48]